MVTYALFVRAVNVGGAKLPMAEFRGMLEELGAADVRTYIASGNAVLDLGGEPDDFARSVERELESRYGYRREVMLRTPEELRDALAAHPFEVIDERFSYIAMLSAEPSADGLAAASGVRASDDLWQVIGRELHLRYTNGAGKAELNQETLARRLGVAATARNLRTIGKLIDLSS
ncbi:uncharacterized protein (DUF1697 family) [Microbacteriaceae bacterium SG_E_30_P1]|uniref:Uncharacterized protein (DUF1697 family) n=1 Tax=Antiquaquibacter oligotrophicus TaxID=2880260 RepID=A0ABT6KM13_9MICO|nr:DUF1697 domain-containing protein [Antiquaquibacter oligotrophicus]MDH6180147.1 uncharacterized protein (DUF1697 family) [Antiquaquibacter oligotrophicus]UDF14101.1 DUF1697 domain-containing protein [Antiquaquibacter oligotrophicus]